MNESRLAVLVVGTDDWAADQAASALRRNGVTVLRCHEADAPAFPCNAFIPGKVCPLEQGFDVVVTARARPSRSTEPGEVGAICALRTQHPLVLAGVTADNPFGSLATVELGEGGDLVTACDRAAKAAEDAANAAELSTSDATSDVGEVLIDLRPAHS